MSPIFVRPVREQLEHDRLVRHLETKYRRKFDVAMNPGDVQTAPVKIGVGTFFPDLVLSTGKKLAGLVEVESGESVNNLEAMAQWVHFSRMRVPFHLYVPMHVYDSAKRLSDANHAHPSEIWAYRALADGSFDLVRMFADANAIRGASAAARKAAAVTPAAAKPVAPSGAKPGVRNAAPTGAKTGAKPTAKSEARPAKKSAPAPAKKPAKKTAPTPKRKPAVSTGKKKR